MNVWIGQRCVWWLPVTEFNAEIIDTFNNLMLSATFLFCLCSVLSYVHEALQFDIHNNNSTRLGSECEVNHEQSN